MIFVPFTEKVTWTKTSSSNEELEFILIEGKQDQNCFIAKLETYTCLSCIYSDFVTVSDPKILCKDKVVTQSN